MVTGSELHQRASCNCVMIQLSGPGHVLKPMADIFRRCLRCLLLRMVSETLLHAKCNKPGSGCPINNDTLTPAFRAVLTAAWWGASTTSTRPVVHKPARTSAPTNNTVIWTGSCCVTTASQWSSWATNEQLYHVGCGYWWFRAHYCHTVSCFSLVAATLVGLESGDTQEHVGRAVKTQ